MKPTIAVIAAVALLLLPIRGPAQTSTVPWWGSGTGFEVSSSSTTIVKSLMGQSAVSTLQGPNNIIESGFLADTLLREIVNSVALPDVVPKEYALRQNYPNPFNPSTTIRFELPHFSRVSLIVYNMLGQEVATIVNEEEPVGVYTVQFNGTALASGVYFYRLLARDFVATKRLLLLK